MKMRALQLGLAAIWMLSAASSQAQLAERRSMVIPTYSDMAEVWQRVDGCAKRIAIAEPGHPFVTGCGNTDATAVYYLNDASVFEPTGDSATMIAPSVGPMFRARDHYSISNEGSLSGYPSACLKEVGSGLSAADSSVFWIWGLSCSKDGIGQNQLIVRRISNATNNDGFGMLGDTGDMTFHSYPGAGVRLGVGLTDSVAWVINSDGAIWRQNYCKSTDADESVAVTAFCQSVPDGWERIPGCGRAISNGGSNRVWIIGCDADANGNGSIYEYAGANQSGPIAAARWTKRAGRAKEIAVDNQGRPWVVKADGSIWRWVGAVPGKGEKLESDPAERRAADPN